VTIRDEGAHRGAVDPGTTRQGDFPAAAGPYTPPVTRPRHSDVSTGRVLSRYTEGSEDRRDRVRWGPIWAGAAVVLTVFVVLQLLVFALGWLDLGFNNGSGTTAGIVTGVLALIAFSVGGLTAGACGVPERGTRC
jgi:hypothetical protein